MATALAALVADLASVGADERELEPLRRLVTDLTRHVRAEPAARTPAARRSLRTRVLTTLSAFARA